MPRLIPSGIVLALALFPCVLVAHAEDRAAPDGQPKEEAWRQTAFSDQAVEKAIRQGVQALLSAQKPDGSWGGSSADTFQSLFSLSLLGRPAGRGIRKAVDWLTEVHRPVFECQAGDGVSYDGLFFQMTRADRARMRKLSGVPFSTGCSGFVKSGAALHLATVFGVGDADRIERAFDTFASAAKARSGRWCSASCGNNVLQAFAVRPDYARHPSMDLALAWIESLQDDRGDWGPAPFYPTFWAMSCIANPIAERQFERALPRVAKLQGRDGLWGRSDRSFKTYMVLDACRRRGVDISPA